jgi:hypothetical protein
MFNSVDLPHPLGPTTETNEPARTSRPIAAIAEYPAKRFVTLSNRIARSVRLRSDTARQGAFFKIKMCCRGRVSITLSI